MPQHGRERVPALRGGQRVVRVAEDARATGCAAPPRRRTPRRPTRCRGSPAGRRRASDPRRRPSRRCRTPGRRRRRRRRPAASPVARSSSSDVVGAAATTASARPRGPGAAPRPSAARPTTRPAPSSARGADRRPGRPPRRPRARAPARPAAAGPPGQRHPRRDRGEPERGDQRRRGRRPPAAPGRRRRRRSSSARLPSPGAIPAEVANHTRVPGATAADALDHADPLHPGHVGHGRRPEVRRAGGAEQVERHDRRGGHPHQRSAPARAATGSAVAAGRCSTAARSARAAVQDGGAHVLRWRCRGRAARGAPSPCRTPSGTPAAPWSRSNIAMNRVSVRNGCAPSPNSADVVVRRAAPRARRR